MAIVKVHHNDRVLAVSLPNMAARREERILGNAKALQQSGWKPEWA
jgi:hypothetical protein